MKNEDKKTLDNKIDELLLNDDELINIDGGKGNYFYIWEEFLNLLERKLN